MTTQNFNPYDGDNVMDSRDINSYLEELIDEVSSELQDTFNIDEDNATMFIDQYEGDKELTKAQNKIVDRIYTAMDNAESRNNKKKWFDEGRLDKIKDLREIVNECSGGDWDYGISLIKEDYFEDYAKELAEGIGAIKDDAVWPTNCIDWEQAADELKGDYTTVEFEGETYYFR